jgi:putative DNA primase/helicase
MSIGEAKIEGNSHASLLTRLTPRHLADLRASGLSDEQIIACGFYSLQAPESIRQRLQWKKYDGSLGDCLCIPFMGLDGKPTGYSRLKPDRPRQQKEDGKPVKYESAKGAKNRAYLPPATRSVLMDPTIPLVITEGEKKAAKADQEGILCIGLIGVYGWQKKRDKEANGKPIGERELIDDLAGIAWKGRTVYIVFDSDAATNPRVRMAEWHLALALVAHGAVVKVIRMPPGEPGQDRKPAKVGLDDFLVAHGPQAFSAIAPTDPVPPERGIEVKEEPDDPHRLVRLVIRKRFTHQDRRTLHTHNSERHEYNGSTYVVKPEEEIRAMLTAETKVEMDRVNLLAQKLADPKKAPPAARKVTSRLISDVAHVLNSETMIPSSVVMPAWLGSDGPFPAGEIMACKNGLVHLPSLVTDKPNYFLPPTPRFFSTNCLEFDFPFDFRQTPPATTVLDQFLMELWPDDQQSIDTLQEYVGYLLTPDTRLQKILMLIGPPRSGKGTIARVIRALIGPHNIAAPTLGNLGMQFGLWPLLGKSVAMIQDARLSGRTDSAAVVERLLSISGEDAQTIDRKNLPSVTVKLNTRFVLVSNELPKLNDASGALAGRMVLLRLTRSWLGKEDIGLTDRLLRELPGILLWAIAGWHRLHERGYFVQPDSSRELMEELGDLASPIGAFVKQKCRVDPEADIDKAVLFLTWQQWCKDQGKEHAGDNATFGRNLRAAVPAVRSGSRRDGENRVQIYKGIGLL